MILLVNELFEGHYLIPKHQPHIETYMGGCHFPSLHPSRRAIVKSPVPCTQQNSGERKKEEMAALTVSYSTLCYTGVITRPRYLQE